MSFTSAAPRRRTRSALAATAAALGLGLACAAPASATLDNPDICGTYANNGQQLMQLLPSIGDGTPGKGFLCTAPVTDMPPFYDYTPDQDAPDPIDPSGDFDSNYAYIIGPNGAAANWTGISTNRIIATAIESVASGLTTAAFVAWAFPPASLAASFGGLVVGATIDVLINVGSQIYDAYEDMAGSDWDVYVPSSSGSGDWHGWIFWDGFGEVQTTTIDPHLVNQYYYNLQDYVDETPTAYVRLYVGVSQRPVEQGDQIVDDAWNSWVAGNGAFTSAAGRARRRRSAERASRASTSRAATRPSTARRGTTSCRRASATTRSTPARATTSSAAGRATTCCWAAPATTSCAPSAATTSCRAAPAATCCSATAAPTCCSAAPATTSSPTREPAMAAAAACSTAAPVATS